MIGDEVDDAKAGNTAGDISILVSTGYGIKHRHLIGADALYVSDLLGASLSIPNNGRDED